MHELRAPLNNLLKKDVSGQKNEKSAKIKKELLLTHFDPNLNIVIASDASDTGIGAVVLHKYGQQCMLQGQIGKEALAIIFAMKKFHSSYMDVNLFFKRTIDRCYQYMDLKRMFLHIRRIGCNASDPIKL